MNAFETLKARALQETTDQIADAVIAMGGGGQLEEHERMARAALLDAYQERRGDEAVEALLTKIGM